MFAPFVVAKSNIFQGVFNELNSLSKAHERQRDCQRQIALFDYASQDLGTFLTEKNTTKIDPPPTQISWTFSLRWNQSQDVLIRNVF